jgi:hypothetical protein
MSVQKPVQSGGKHPSVTLYIESQTTDTITTALYIGHQSPNLTEVRHTFRRQGSSWTFLRREKGPEIRI